MANSPDPFYEPQPYYPAPATNYGYQDLTPEEEEYLNGQRQYDKDEAERAERAERQFRRDQKRQLEAGI